MVRMGENKKVPVNKSLKKTMKNNLHVKVRIYEFNVLLCFKHSCRCWTNDMNLKYWVNGESFVLKRQSVWSQVADP